MEEKGVALGNVLLLARNGAAFYRDLWYRKCFTTEFVTDVFNGDYNRTLEMWDSDLECNISESYPNYKEAINEFCTGVIGAEAFRHWATARRKVRNNETRRGRRPTHLPPFVRTNVRREARAIDSSDDDDDDIDAEDVPDDDGNNADTESIRIWLKAVNHVFTATKNTDDESGLKIEFERVYETDTTSGGGVFNANFNNSAVTRTESAKAISPFGFLNRAAVFGSASDSNSVHYKSYMFGSNVIIFDNELINYSSLDSLLPPNTDKRHLQRALNLNDAELDRFVSDVVRTSGGAVADCPRYGGCKRTTVTHSQAGHKRKRNAHESAIASSSQLPENGLRFTSFNRLNNSVQFTFSTHYGKYYFTANLFWLRADDFCTNDLVFRRSTVSSLCQCDRPTLVWRACLLVTPINTATVQGDARVEIDRVTLATFAAFKNAYENKNSNDDSRLAVLSGFLGTPVVPIHPTHLNPIPNREDGVFLFPTCSIHRWLRAYSVSDWIGRDRREFLTMLRNKGGRGVIVHRPILTRYADKFIVGQKAFTAYMTFEDIAKKVLLLTKNHLINGYTDPILHENECVIAYERGPDFIEFEHADAIDGDDDDDEFVQERAIVGGPGRLWSTLYETPSVLYVDIALLATLGFNPVSFAVAHEGEGRTFEHVDPATGETCKVYCSVLLRAIDTKSETVLNEPGDTLSDSDRRGESARTYDTGIKVLRTETADVSPLERYRTPEFAMLENGELVDVHSRYRETIHDLSEFWPGVRAIKITFTDSQLRHVEFVFFAGRDFTETPTLAGLHALSERCERDGSLPPPVLYTLQKETLNTLYGR